VTEVPPFVLQAADAFGLDRTGLRSLGGNAGSSWSAGTAVLRVGFTAVLDAELAAAGAAAAVLPVPTVLDRADFAGRLDDLPAAARAWACRFMLADLARRYSPAELAHVQRTLDELA
jgi:hypothetical protein